MFLCEKEKLRITNLKFLAGDCACVQLCSVLSVRISKYKMRIRFKIKRKFVYRSIKNDGDFLYFNETARYDVFLRSAFNLLKIVFFLLFISYHERDEGAHFISC